MKRRDRRTVDLRFDALEKRQMLRAGVIPRPDADILAPSAANPQLKPPTPLPPARVVAVGDTLDIHVARGNLRGPQLTYTITPQPLPVNLLLNPSTGELVFAPAPGQTGRYVFAVQVSDGTRSQTRIVPITVVERHRPTTELTGRVVDQAGRPAAGVPIELGMGAAAITTTTNAQGRFVLRNVSTDAGAALMVDGTHARSRHDLMMLMAPAAQFATHTLYAGVTNTIPAAIVLPVIDLKHATDFRHIDVSKPQDLTSPLLPGVVLHVAPHSAMTVDGKAFKGKLALTRLPVAKLHEILPADILAGSMVGVDGTNLMFTTPAKITLPNTSGFAPGSLFNIMAMDMVSGGFTVTGHLQVTADGQSLVTIDGGLSGPGCVFPTVATPAVVSSPVASPPGAGQGAQDGSPANPGGGATTEPVVAATLNVGSTLDTFVTAPGLAAAGVTYTITPQPLPANMLFNRSTGELTFAPSPDQVGRWDFSVAASDGTSTVLVPLTITVANPPEASTTVSGQIVDESGQPLAGVPVMIGMIETTTDKAGLFTLHNVPDQPGPLTVDGYHADAAGDYMMLMAPTAKFLGHPVYTNATNVVPAPITLPHIDLEHATDFAAVNGAKPQDLTSPLLPGVVVHVPAGSAMTMGMGMDMGMEPFTGKIALTALPVDKLREILPDSYVPGALFVGLDGPGLMFEQPAQLTLPNTEHYAPGAVLNLMTMNMTSGGFDLTGHLQVTPDGQSLVTIDGGITGSSCLGVISLGPGDGVPTTLCLGCQEKASGKAPAKSDVGLVTGEYLQDHAIVPYQSQGMERALDFQYSSLQADPRPVVGFEPTTQVKGNASAITSITASLSVGGVNQGSAVTYTPPVGFSDGATYRASYQADATALATGLYPYNLTVTHSFSGTTVSAVYSSQLSVVNAISSPYGAGWSVGGVQRISQGSAGAPVLITAGNEGTERFDRSAAHPLIDLGVVTQGALSVDTAYLLKNDGMGGFSSPTSGATTTMAATDAAAGDFNGDGYTDLAVIGGASPTWNVSVHPGSATGFGSGSTVAAYSSSSYPEAIRVGDFTGDGKPDLVVLRADGKVDVLPGSGGGSFGTAVTTSVGGGAVSNPGSMAVGDFNGDGKLDLAVATAGDGNLHVLTGNGSGGFGSSSSYSLGGFIRTQQAAAGDFNGDGKVDLAVTSGFTNAYQLSMFLNNGSGSFSNSSTFAAGAAPGISALATGDFNGDGVSDVALWETDSSDGAFVIVPGNSLGSWGPAVRNLITGAGATGASTNMVAGDFNGDGKPDVAVSETGHAFVAVLETDPGSNQMEAGFVAGVTGTTIAVIAAGQFSGASLAERYTAPMGDTSTLVHNGGGTWTRTYADGTVLQFDSSGRETSATDRNGNATSYAYVTSGPATGALSTVTDPVGRVTTLAYDVSGHLRTVTDPAGRVTTFTVDGSGNMTSVTDPDGAVTGYAYATPANHRLTTETDPNTHAATAHYDSFGRFDYETLPGTGTTQVSSAEERGLLAPGGSGPLPTPANDQGVVTDPNGNATTYTFDAMGHPASQTDATNKSTTFLRDMNGWATAVTDPLGRTTSYAYDMKGNVTSIKRPDLSVMTTVYNSTFSVPTAITDFRGLTTSFTLDSHGNTTRRTDPDLGHEDWTYNAAGQVLTDTDRNGHTTTLAYDSFGRLTTLTYPGTSVPKVVLAYDSAGDLVSATDELGHRTTFTYDLAGRVLSTQDPVQAAAGKATSYVYDAHGNETSMTDALGHVTSYAYDVRDRLISVVDPVNQGTGRATTFGYDGMNLTGMTDPLGHQTTYAYDGDNREIGMSDPLGHRTTYTYDDAGELKTVTDANANTTSYTYDNDGRLQTVILPAIGGGGTATTTYGYDADDNVTSITDPLSHAQAATFDNLNRLATSADGLAHTTTYGYDAAGNLTTVTDPLGHVTTHAYDVRDRVISDTDPTGGGTTTYTYDDHSRLTRLTDPVGNVTSYGYDLANRVTTETDPRSKVTTYAYDLVGNLTQKTDRLGRITQVGYDADNRPTTETWRPPGGGTALYNATITYDAAGRETAIQDTNSKYAYTYDNANRLLTVDDTGTTGLPQVTLTYGYDNIGERTSLADTKGGVNSYTYDVRNELTKITQSGTGVASKSVQMAYDAAGNQTSLTRYSDITGTTKVAVTSYAYDSANRMTTITNQTSAGATIASYGYTLDAANRLTSETRTWNGGSSTDTVTYGYTNNDQLTSVSHTNGSFANETFAYDSNGNRNSTGYTTGTANETSSDGTYTYGYDDEGNLISKTTIATGNQTLYTWDTRNRLIEVDSKVGATTTPLATYTYDALNNPIKVVEGGATRYTLYDGQTPLLDFNGSGTLTARYLDGPAVDQVLARETTGGVVAWYITDRLGTVRDLVNNSGTVIDHIDYSVYGKVTAESSPANGDRFKFAGMELDATTGLDYDRARWYDPASGKFVSSDPTGFGGRDANLYRYVSNGPADGIDPYGLQLGEVSTRMGGRRNPDRPVRPGPRPTPPSLTEPNFPPRTVPVDQYYRQQYPTPVFFNPGPDDVNVRRMGCKGLASLRIGLLPWDLNVRSSALAWFDNPAAAAIYYDSIKSTYPGTLIIMAIQASSIPNIGYITPYPGMIYPITGAWDPPQPWNYATWQQTPGYMPFWEYANNGDITGSGSEVYCRGALAGPPYKVTIYGILPSKSPHPRATK